MDLVISTKLSGGGRGARDSINSVGLSRKHLVEGMRASLDRLGLEYVDLVFAHRRDPRTPMVEVVRGMNHLIDKGLAFHWGTSEWTAQEIEEAKGIAKEGGPLLVGPQFEQASYSMLLRDRVEMEHRRLYPEMGLTAYAPLQGGRLTGRRRRGAEEDHLRVSEGLGPIAERLGCSVAQLAVAWCLTNPNVSSCIMGASRLEQAVDNLGACRVARQLEAEGGAAVLAEVRAVSATILLPLLKSFGCGRLRSCWAMPLRSREG